MSPNRIQPPQTAITRLRIWRQFCPLPLMRLSASRFSQAASLPGIGRPVTEL